MMDYIYGELQKAVEKVTYEGLHSKTAVVIVDNEKNTIQVNIVDVPVSLLSPKIDITDGKDGKHILVGTVEAGVVNYKWSNIEEFLAKFEGRYQELLEKIGDEATTREAQDLNLKADIDNEIEVRQAQIATERNERTAQDDQIKEDLAAEIQERANQDAAIKGNLAAEVSRATAAEEAIQAELDKKLDKTGGTVSGSLIISENLIVNGTTSTVHTQNLKVTDKLIYLAKDNELPLTSPAGLITPKYDGTNNGGIVYDNTGTAYVGDISLDSNGNVDVDNSDLQPIATRSSIIANGNIVKWDSTSEKLVDSGKKVDDLSTATNLENGTGDVLIQTKDSNHSFKVMKDGRAKVYGEPTEDDNVLRLSELPVLTSSQVDLLF